MSTTQNEQNETMYELFCKSYSLAASYAARIADEIEARHEEAPISIRPTEIEATVRPAKH